MMDKLTGMAVCWSCHIDAQKLPDDAARELRCELLAKPGGWRVCHTMNGSSERMDVVDKKQTIREQIISSLEAGPMTARDLSRALRIREKDAYSHLPSVAKSIKHQKKQIQITPCYCLSCGFEFKDRKSFKKPGKCPVCRQSRIEPAVFVIVGG
jgi:transcriptional regulator